MKVEPKELKDRIWGVGKGESEDERNERSPDDSRFLPESQHMGHIID